MPGDRPTPEQLRLSAGRLAGELGRSGGSSGLTAVAAARDLARVVEQAMRTAVEDARAAGHTWQEIGDVLGTTRQAAFQRFGRPVDPRTGETMAQQVLPGVADNAIGVLGEVIEGNWEAARRDFDDTMLETVTTAKLAAAWAHVCGLVGAYERLGEPVAYQAGDYSIVDLPLFFEAGDMTARVTYRRDGRIAGLFIKPTASL